MAAPMEENLNLVIESLNLGFTLKERQIKSIKHLIAGEDVFAVLPTGYGKSAIYSVLPRRTPLPHFNDVSAT